MTVKLTITEAPEIQGAHCRITGCEGLKKSGVTFTEGYNVT